MAARINKTELHEKWRQRIGVGIILDRLVKHVNGKLNLTPTQIRAAEILLKKAMPDLAHTQTDAEVNGKLTVTWEK